MIEVSASDPVPDNDEEDVDKAVPEKKLTVDNLAEAFCYTRMLLPFFFFFTMWSFL